MKFQFNVRNVVVALTALGLLLLPVYSHLTGNIFILTLFTRIVIFALAAASLNLIMGYGGMMSFGHAAYLGIGGYAVGILAFEGSGRWRWRRRRCMRSSSARCRCGLAASISS
jgi:branched-chain amino acid transport system permease protein